MADQLSNFHGAKEGLIDIKPILLKQTLPYELLIYPLFALALFLFLYIVYHSLKIRRAKRIVIGAYKEAITKLDNYPNNLSTIKDKAEYLSETLKSFLSRKGLKSAVALESTIKPSDFTLQLKSIFYQSTNNDLEPASAQISTTIIELLKYLEEIEYTYIKENNGDTLEPQLNAVKGLIGQIELLTQRPKSEKKKNKLRNKSSTKLKEDILV